MKNSPVILAKAHRNLLIVISAGVICALLLAAVMLGGYNPSGRYIAQNVMLSP